MKTRILLSGLLASLMLVASVALAAPKPAGKQTGSQTIPPFPRILMNARYVYVTSYDGNQFNPALLPEDRQAISSVQDAIQKWGKFIVVYEPQQADIVMMVMSRPSEDVLDVYDAHGWPGNGQYLWRMTARNGLQQNETPLVADLQKAFEQIKGK